MEDQTGKLLEKCNLGCKMGVNSMNQVCEFVEDQNLSKIIGDYKCKHEKMEQEAEEMLKECGKEVEKISPMASAMSWLTTEAKLMIKDDSNQISKLMMDGCNMGIQELTESMHKYPEASAKSISLAKEIVRTDEDLLKDLKAFL